MHNLCNILLKTFHSLVSQFLQIKLPVIIYVVFESTQSAVQNGKYYFSSFHNGFSYNFQYIYVIFFYLYHNVLICMQQGIISFWTVKTLMHTF